MKVAIVDRQSNRVVSSYQSCRIEQRTNYFGGPWDDPSQYEHVEIPSDLQNDSIFDLEPYDGEVQTGTQMIQDGVELCFDDEDQPILGPNGEQQSIPKYVQQPIMSPKRLMRRKS